MRWRHVAGTPRTLNNGRLEIGRTWLAWRGWRRPTLYRIGSTVVFAVGPVAVFSRGPVGRWLARAVHAWRVGLDGPWPERLAIRVLYTVGVLHSPSYLG